MLYGIDTRDRDRKGYLADKNRYQPWSGRPHGGGAGPAPGTGGTSPCAGGARGTAPFGAFSAVYTGTEEPVPGLTGDTCGELLLGVGQEVFERSAFVGQGGALAVTSAPELERRIAALVSSGEEDVSFSQAEGRLREWLNRRKVNKSVGLIPRLEGELAETGAVPCPAGGGQPDPVPPGGGEGGAGGQEDCPGGGAADPPQAGCPGALDRRYTQAQAGLGGCPAAG